jgi:hypothetical protein
MDTMKKVGSQRPEVLLPSATRLCIYITMLLVGIVFRSPSSDIYNKTGRGTYRNTIIMLHLRVIAEIFTVI